MRGNDVTRPGFAVMITTVRPTPAARTRSSTSVGPIVGIGTSRSAIGAPNFGRTMAFIWNWGRERLTPQAPHVAPRLHRHAYIATRNIAGHAYTINRPPFTASVWPVRYEDSGAARNSTQPTMSETSAMRPISDALPIASRCSGVRSATTRSLAVVPGAIVFTVT